MFQNVKVNQMSTRLSTILVAVASANTMFLAGALNAAEWQITSVNGVATQGEAWISFTPDGAFGGSTGCNRFQGAGRVDEGSLLVEGPVAATQMACPGDELSRQEDGIFGLLVGSVDVFFDPFAERMTLVQGAATAELISTSAAPIANSPPAEPAPPEPAQPEPPALATASFVNVYGVSDRLNIHSEPSVSSPVVGKAEAGTMFRNKGCEPGEAHDWCNVVYLDASGIEGWAAAEFLEPAVAATRAGAGVFDRIGTLDCTDSPNGAVEKCDFGIALDADGTAVVAVFRNDGLQRLLTFVGGTFAFTDTSEAAGGFDAAATRDGEHTIVVVEGERYEIEDSILTGR